jgi:UDP-glucose 4-epimerase
MTKVLITGAAGLIGSHFSKYLLDKGYEVVGADDLSGGYLDYVDERLKNNKKFYNINLNESPKVDELFRKEKPDYVYHFAAYAAEGLSPFIRNFNYTNNLLSSVNVINNCITYDVKKIIFTSSMAVYGEGTPPFSENDAPRPADPYGIAKYAVEMDLKQAHDQFGLRYSITRPHNVIGIYQNIWDKYRNVIGIWIRNTLAGEPIQVYGDGTQKRAFSDIKFYMEPFEKLMSEEFDGEIFNLGADQEFELNTIAELIKKIGIEFGFKPDIKHVESRHEVKNAYCNHDKAKKMLGFKDDTNIEHTIRDMFTWAKGQPKRAIKNMNYEIHKNMYSFWKQNDEKIQLPNVTLFAVACTKVDETIYALRKSMEGIKFAEAILITHEKISLDALGIKVYNIDKLNYKEYNHFVAYKLPPYIKTDYALHVQNDGYILRPEKWDPEFLKYDYIGAPWPPNVHFTNEGVNVRVGNGGFAFRSKKLLNILNELNLPFTDNGTGFFHEDGLLCVYHRRALEDAGIKFAPVEVASRFSHETDCFDSVWKPFGFHGSKLVLPRVFWPVKKILRKMKIRI